MRSTAATSLLPVLTWFTILWSSSQGPFGGHHVLAQSDCLSIPEIACTTEGFETLCELVTSTGLDQILAEEGPFTVFAPLNTSFDLLGSDVVNALLNDTGRYTHHLSFVLDLGCFRGTTPSVLVNYHSTHHFLLLL